MKVAILIDRLGPYHVARLEAASKYMEPHVLEIFGESSEYMWDKVDSKILKSRITLFENQNSRTVPAKAILQKVNEQLSAIRPQVVSINGWYDKSALSALLWCKLNKVPSIVMSDSTEIDEKRVWWKESLKKQIVRMFEAGFVAGMRHSAYLEKLGMDKKAITRGYDVVDNHHFKAIAAQAQQNNAYWTSELSLPENYFIAVSRFVTKKNIPFLLKAYSKYFQMVGSKANHLVILGDGPLKVEIEQTIASLGIRNHVHIKGFKQYHELPIYLGMAKALIHASTSEQWGLVVNEAMAAGLPVVVSERCGCVPELVHHGRNGYTFDPFIIDGLVDAMEKLTADPDLQEQFGKESSEIINSFSTDTFARGLLNAANIAVSATPKKMSFTGKLILTSFLKK